MGLRALVVAVPCGPGYRSCMELDGGGTAGDDTRRLPDAILCMLAGLCILTIADGGGLLARIGAEGGGTLGVSTATGVGEDDAASAGSGIMSNWSLSSPAMHTNLCICS